MFTKYMNQFRKAEAEWVLEVLDMHDGEEDTAREAVISSVERIIAHSKGEPVELTGFDKTVHACCFANQMWWPVGLARLRELGRIT